MSGIKSASVLIGLPKVAIALMVCWAGGKLLMVENSVANVVMKALCLQYFVSIDELLDKIRETVGVDVRGILKEGIPSTSEEVSHG